MPTTNYNLPTISGNMTADAVRDMNALAVATDSAIKQAVAGVDLTGITQDVRAVDTRVTTHLDDSMPHKYVGNGKKTYRWGLGEDAGGIYFAREEVI